MTCSSLKELDLDSSDCKECCMLKTLQQLLHSSVTTLNIVNTGFCKFLMHSRGDFNSALKVLLSPSSGKLEKLYVGCDYRGDDYCSDRLARLVSGPSSLKFLSLILHTGLSSHVPYLKSNTCLTTLHLVFRGKYNDNLFPAITEIVEYNKTLQHLELNGVYTKEIDSLRTFVDTISKNKTLLSIRLLVCYIVKLPDYIRTVDDQRIAWK